jgi:cytochrome b involved in lipid metabolism
LIRPVEIKKTGDITLTEVSEHNKPHDCWVAATGPY